MSERDESPESAGAEPAGDPGLFSQLPRTRPGTRSPRRASKAEAGRKPSAKPRTPAALRAAKASVRPEPASASKPKPTPRSEPPRPRAAAKAGSGSGSDEGTPSGIEELAWAGIAVTAEAATLGVRLIGRAFDAARKATERHERG